MKDHDQCVAIIDRSSRYKMVRYQRCQNQALATIDGARLCGTHINAIWRGPLMVLRELDQQ